MTFRRSSRSCALAPGGNGERIEQQARGIDVLEGIHVVVPLRHPREDPDRIAEHFAGGVQGCRDQPQQRADARDRDADEYEDVDDSQDDPAMGLSQASARVCWEL